MVFLSSLVILVLSLRAVFAAIGETVPLCTEGAIPIPFSVNDTVYRTWVSRHVDPNPLALSARPLVVLHGGPGLTHDYMLPLADLSASRPVIFYDQIGSGRSSHPANDTAFDWGLDVFLHELDNVLRVLNLENDFDLLGHSWGGVVAAEYAVQRNNTGLNRLIISDSLPSDPLWIQSQVELLSAFPEEVQLDMEAGYSDPVRYRAGLTAFFSVHGCTLDPWPKQLNDSFDFLFADPTPDIKMSTAQTGWSIIDRLYEITVPTLILNGAADISQDYVNQPFLDNIRNVTHFKFKNSSHTPMWEERELYMEVVRNFLG
ncbi:hypothetical protein AAF712_014020 [Marasmius tenuissimus]|uniref:AB hydrolase-1 domain-containing protein n=1 Tax=Marasmius tenuissimus TaxID=585030 RepID=A0ABR2ZDE3_9AGAR|nr:hypothetical protein PM082_020883 [Marasmius tenuissimus]